MELKNKIRQIILRVVCGIFLITTIFFGVVAASYSIGGGAPNIFGTYVYLVKTDAFDLLENGTALVAKEVHPSEIQPWNIVIFELENGEPALAEIRSGQLYDGVYSFEASTENGAVITLSQSQIVAMGTSYSNVWGKIISFATSPVGVFLLALVPCLVIIIIELSKFISKSMPQPEIETVKKQLEVPTYVPDGGRAGAVNAYKAARNTSLDDSIGLYDVQVKQSSGVERGNHRTDVLEIPAQESPLFLGPKHKPVTVQKRTSQDQILSQKKLNEAIAAARAEREMGLERERAVKEIQKNRGAAIAAEKEQEERYVAMRRVAEKEQEERYAAMRRAAEQSRVLSRPASTASSPKSQPTTETATLPRQEATKIQNPEQKPASDSRITQRSRTAAVKPEDDSVKQYTPKSATHATTSIPRLDALLNEDVDGDSYNIDDILASLDRRG